MSRRRSEGRSRAPYSQLVWVVLAAGCASNNWASDEDVALAEARLMAPYHQARTVVSDHLEIDVSANFFAEVAQPAANPAIHRFSQSEDEGDQVYRWMSQGGLQSPLRFRVVQVDFAVLQSATLRVRGTGKEMALNAVASGHVTETQDGAGLQNWSEIQIENGNYRTR